MIYFIQQGKEGPIKIGFTNKAISCRIKALQTSNPLPLTLLGVIEGDRNAERLLHKKFDNHRLNGEWFSSDTINDLKQIITTSKLPLIRSHESSSIHERMKHIRNLVRFYRSNSTMMPSGFTLNFLMGISMYSNSYIRRAYFISCLDLLLCKKPYDEVIRLLSSVHVDLKSMLPSEREQILESAQRAARKLLTEN